MVPAPTPQLLHEEPPTRVEVDAAEIPAQARPMEAGQAGPIAWLEFNGEPGTVPIYKARIAIGRVVILFFRFWLDSKISLDLAPRSAQGNTQAEQSGDQNLNDETPGARVEIWGWRKVHFLLLHSNDSHLAKWVTVIFYSIVSGTISSSRKDSEQLVHWASRLLAITNRPPHLGHGMASGFFHEVKSQFG